MPLSSIRISYYLFNLGLLSILPSSALDDFATHHEFIYIYYSQSVIADVEKFYLIVFYTKKEAHFPS